MITIKKVFAVFILAYFVAVLIGVMIAAFEKKKYKNSFFANTAACIAICFYVEVFIAVILLLFFIAEKCLKVIMS